MGNKKWLKFEDIDIGTKIRTFLRIAISLNTAVLAVSAAIGTLEIGWLTTLWAVVTIMSDFLVSFLTTYYNNDYSEEASVGTEVGRKLALDPTLVVVETVDGDADDEDEEDEDDPGEYDETIEEGE